MIFYATNLSSFLSAVCLGNSTFSQNYLWENLLMKFYRTPFGTPYINYRHLLVCFWNTELLFHKLLCVTIFTFGPFDVQDHKKILSSWCSNEFTFHVIKSFNVFWKHFNSYLTRAYSNTYKIMYAWKLFLWYPFSGFLPNSV